MQKYISMLNVQFLCTVCMYYEIIQFTALSKSELKHKTKNQCTFFIDHFVKVEFKNIEEIYCSTVTLPSNQSDTSDVVIMTSQLINKLPRRTRMHHLTHAAYSKSSKATFV